MQLTRRGLEASGTIVVGTLIVSERQVVRASQLIRGVRRTLRSGEGMRYNVADDWRCRRVLVVATALALSGVLAASTRGMEPPKAESLIGTWQLVSRTDQDPSGQIIPAQGLGAEPTGYLVYDNSGHVFVQMMARQRVGSPCDLSAPADSNNLALVGGYDAYFGRYEVDVAAGVVRHILEGALGPADVGRTLTRRFQLAGDTLTIQFEPGGSTQPRRVRTLVWKRASR
jgi:hypothetical protein